MACCLLPTEDPWQTLEAGLAAFEPGFQPSRGGRRQPLGRARLPALLALLGPELDRLLAGEPLRFYRCAEGCA
jgi:hypothetical protein